VAGCDARSPLFRRDHAGRFLLIAIPLIAFAVLTWAFSSAVVRGLNVVVVDMDRSAISTEVIQQIAAAPGLRVSQRGDNLTTATRAIRSGEAIAAVFIPAKFEHDLLAGLRPQIVAFYNTQYFTPGNIASKGLRDAILPLRQPSRRCTMSGCSRSAAAPWSSRNMSSPTPP
jgi:ABC-2 type transport system permease protein